ncbi:hypothetical protein OROGR_016328 [Orobanche gracilis]
MWSNTNVLTLLGIIILVGSHVITQGEALVVRRYTFVLRNSAHTRLCTNKTMLTINGQFPGPTIYARRGDLVIVNVHNRAEHNITIHWPNIVHGVKMLRYPWSDGPEYVTQCPISPGISFSQRVVLSDEEGTLWWHAHSEWYRASVYGALIILPQKNNDYPFPTPHAEVPLLLGDWWNADVQKVMEEFLANGGDPNVSDAFLINGQPGDLYRCSTQDTFKLTVQFGKTYLIRMVNAVMNNIMFFRIANHTLTVVGTDGAYTKHLKTDYIAISPGQTIDFLLEANQPRSHYYIASRVYASAGEFDNTTTTAIIQYIGNYTPPPSPSLPSFPPFAATNVSRNFTNRLRSLANQKYPIDVPKNVTHNLLFTLSINLRPCADNTTCDGPFGERLLASMNNVTLLLPRTAILQAYYEHIRGIYRTDFPSNPPFVFNYTQEFVPRDLWRPRDGTDVYVVEYNSTVEIVFQGTNAVAGVDHPMHLHGYSFFVIGSGLGNFDKDRDPPNYNLVDPPLMETIAVPINGWTAIRFKANNPGVWFMHCHFERHVSWGMGMAFIVRDGEGRNESMLPPPPDMPKC